MHTAASADDHALTSDDVTRALREIVDSRRNAGDSPSEVLHRVSVCGGRVTVHLALQVSGSAELEDLEAIISSRLRALGATDVQVVIRRPERSLAGPLRGRGDPWAGQVRLATVQHVVAVGAGKGGVGKSTIAVNLALALAREGLRAALLDADIYGPSLPILLGIEDGAARARMTPERHILPLEAHGLPLVSFGFFLGERSPAIWRGPMVAKAVQQFARGVAWPSLDVLVVDLPPGTGDVPLSLAQAIELSGAVVVTQPARVAAAEARKAVQMFTALEVPVLGVVENMTGPFGIGAGESMSAELGVPFLGDVPFDAEIVREGDVGTPTVIGRAGSPTAASFDRIAQRVAEALGWRRIGDSVKMAETRARKLPIIPSSDAPPLTNGVLASVDAGRLTANRLDLQDNDLGDVLVSFYAAISGDPLLAPYFASLDMSTHMPRIVAFWSTMLFHTGRYSGNAFRPHLSMPGLTAQHFMRWVATLEHTLDARFAGENVERMKDLAQRIAHSMQLRLGIMPFSSSN